MRAVYADPPYVGQARKHYGCAEIDHAVLIQQLTEYDGWALSCSTPSLAQLLAMCPKGTRVAAWVKPFCIYKRGVNPAYAWESVLYKPLPRKRSRAEPTVRDWVSCNITLRKGLVGAKPEAFCYWLFQLLGLTPDDELTDLFPGTGVVGQCWNTYRTR